MLTSTTANAVNLMAAGSALNNIVPKLKLTPSLWLVTIVATLMSFIPFIVGGFIETFIWFLDLIGMVLGPEIAILLADFFIVQKQNYDRTAFNQGKTYWYTGGFNLRAYIVWALSMGCYFVLQQVPVVVQTVGSNWLTMIFAAVVYVAVSRNQTKML